MDVPLFALLLEKIKEFLRLRRELDRQMFADHVEPVYQHLRKVVDDYCDIFVAAHREFADPSASLAPRI